ncbi:hypothetical protein [Rhizobium sp. NFR07]|uniref:hypothetical protein n=1 Tax=Rhizobium sp. NFR07 TaxID=1566262 RepID=UPI0011604755|nr:hypothetical protein [Rhizobium sp. NFR07]
MILAPEIFISGETRTLAIDYVWETQKLREWEKHVAVRIVLTDAENMQSWSMAVTSAPSGAIILPASLQMSANCQAVFQLRAGDRVGPLHTPPYIPRHSIAVRYHF